MNITPQILKLNIRLELLHAWEDSNLTDIQSVGLLLLLSERLNWMVDNFENGLLKLK